MSAREGERSSKTIVAMTRSDSLISLRAGDWCVTNYAKRRSVVLFHEPSARWFAIHHEYRAWLKTWRRRLFDPFARRSRIFFHTGSAWVATTVAQDRGALIVLLKYLSEVAPMVDGCGQRQEVRRNFAIFFDSAAGRR